MPSGQVPSGFFGFNQVSSSVGSGPEIFGLGLTVLPNVRARALSGLVKCEIFGLGL